MKNFQELIHSIKGKGKKNCVVAKAEDVTVLEAINQATKLNIIKPVLVGNTAAIKECAKKVKLSLADAEIHDVDDEQEAMRTAITLVKEHGDFLMKGMLSSSTFLRGVLDKDTGLRTGHILSHIAVLEVPGYHKLLFMSDGGMNPRLNLKTRLEIIGNGVTTLHMLGINEPKIGLVAASETVNPDMPETVDAVSIVDKYKNGEITGCMIDGPFGFDVAVSRQAAEHKKIQSAIAGDVDFLLMPNISSGNIWAKGLIIFAKAKAAGMVAGAARPVIMLSRADDSNTKVNSIALGVALSSSKKTSSPQ